MGKCTLDSMKGKSCDGRSHKCEKMGGWRYDTYNLACPAYQKTADDYEVTQE